MMRVLRSLEGYVTSTNQICSLGFGTVDPEKAGCFYLEICKLQYHVSTMQLPDLCVNCSGSFAPNGTSYLDVWKRLFSSLAQRGCPQRDVFVPPCSLLIGGGDWFVCIIVLELWVFWLSINTLINLQRYPVWVQYHVCGVCHQGATKSYDAILEVVQILDWAHMRIPGFHCLHPEAWKLSGR